MMDENQSLRSENYICCCQYYSSRFSWTAIVVGALVGLGLIFLLYLFAIGLGFSAITTGRRGAVALSLAGILGVVVSIVIAMIMGGYVTGYLSHRHRFRNLGFLYGFCTWCLALLLGTVIVFKIGYYASLYTKTDEMRRIMPIKSDKRQSLQSPYDDAIVASTEELAYTAFMIFILFLISALAACIGASWAISNKKPEGE